MKKLAFSDDLTALQNRRSILETFYAEFERTRRYGKPLALMIMDIDNFKMINDQYGHETGDKVLKFVAGFFSLQKRVTDHLGRIGGEEFMMLLPETDIINATTVANRILDTLNTKSIDLNGTTRHIFVSIGFTVVQEEDATLHESMRRADTYLYEAKHRGKNNVYSDTEAVQLYNEP